MAHQKDLIKSYTNDGFAVVDIKVVLSHWDNDWSIINFMGTYTLCEIVNKVYRVRIHISESHAKEIIQKASLNYHKSKAIKNVGAWKSEPPKPKPKSIKL